MNEPEIKEIDCTISPQLQTFINYCENAEYLIKVYLYRQNREIAQAIERAKQRY